MIGTHTYHHAKSCSASPGRHIDLMFRAATRSSRVAKIHRLLTALP